MRHHDFIEDINNFLKKERRNYAFGYKYFDVKVTKSNKFILL